MSLKLSVYLFRQVAKFGRQAVLRVFQMSGRHFDFFGEEELLLVSQSDG